MPFSQAAGQLKAFWKIPGVYFPGQAYVFTPDSWPSLAGETTLAKFLGRKIYREKNGVSIKRIGGMQRFLLVATPM
jgi:hypothetical protein